MKEIGGYLELDSNRGPLIHENAIPLDSGRHALEYLIRAKNIRKVRLPLFLCDSVRDTCARLGVEVRYYGIEQSFYPKECQVDEDEWFYLVNYYGQISNEAIANLHKSLPRLIVDNVQAYYQMPVDGIDTIYSCRKFFGVADGAFLYTDTLLDVKLPRMVSYSNMEFVLGRYEKTATEFFRLAQDNNDYFETIPLSHMSKLTENLLRGLDYAFIREVREKNFTVLERALGKYNDLSISMPVAPFCYPLYVQGGSELRKELIANKVYVPLLWPNVLTDADEESLEFSLASDILPLPCDQRYDQSDMERIISIILTQIGE